MSKQRLSEFRDMPTETLRRKRRDQIADIHAQRLGPSSGLWGIIREIDIVLAERSPDESEPSLSRQIAILTQQRDSLVEALRLCRDELHEWQRAHGECLNTNKALKISRAALAKVKP